MAERGRPCENATVKSLAIKVVVNALAIWVATLVVPQVDVTAADTTGRVVTLLVLGAVFGVMNALVKPIVKVLAFPFYVLSLGLFAFVVNALMLELTDWLSDSLGISFSSGPFFWSTIGAAVVVTFVSMVLNLVLPDGKE